MARGWGIGVQEPFQPILSQDGTLHTFPLLKFSIQNDQKCTKNCPGHFHIPHLTPLFPTPPPLYPTPPPYTPPTQPLFRIEKYIKFVSFHVVAYTPSQTAKATPAQELASIADVQMRHTTFLKRASTSESFRPKKVHRMQLPLECRAIVWSKNSFGQQIAPSDASTITQSQMFATCVQVYSNRNAATTHTHTHKELHMYNHKPQYLG